MFLPGTSKMHKSVSQFNPYNNFNILPGCSSTPPGQEIFAAYERLLLRKHKLHPELSLPSFEKNRKRSYLDSDDSSEDDMTESVLPSFHNKITNTKRFQKKKTKIIYSHETYMDTKYVGTKPLPVKNGKILYSVNKIYNEKIPVKIPNISQISDNKPNVIWFNGIKCLSEKKEQMYLQSKLLEVEQIPRKEPKIGGIHDIISNVECLVQKTKMMSFHNSATDNN